MTQIQYEEIPQTFQDAVEITDDLGYITWIDTICSGLKQQQARMQGGFPFVNRPHFDPGPLACLP
jgi:hypothetical protein